MLYGVKEIIEMSKKGIHDSVVDAIVKFHWEIDVEEVLELQAIRNDEGVISALMAVHGEGKKSGKKSAEKVGTGAKAPDEKPKKDYNLDDVKFEKYNDGNCNWNYYKEVRKAYCYRRQGCKVWRGTITKPEGFKFDEDQWNADKKDFEAKFPYIKKADRK